MAKRKEAHQQQRNVVFMHMMQQLGGKSTAHKSKKDYRRQPKNRQVESEGETKKAGNFQPFLFVTKATA